MDAPRDAGRPPTTATPNEPRRPHFVLRTVTALCTQPLFWRALPVAIWLWSAVAVSQRPNLIRLYAMAFPYVKTFPGIPPEEKVESTNSFPVPHSNYIRAVFNFCRSYVFHSKTYSEYSPAEPAAAHRTSNSSSLLLTCFLSVFVMPDLMEVLRSLETYSYLCTTERRGTSPYIAFRETMGGLVGAGLGNLLFLSIVQRMSGKGSWRPFYWTSLLPLVHRVLGFVAEHVRPFSRACAEDVETLAGGLKEPAAASSDRTAASAVAYVCGGGGYGFALSGFRCGYCSIRSDAYYALSTILFDLVAVRLGRYPSLQALCLKMTDLLAFFLPLQRWNTELLEERGRHDTHAVPLAHVFGLSTIQFSCMTAFVGGVAAGSALAELERAQPLRYLHRVWPWFARLVGEPLPPLGVPALLVDVAQPNAGVVEVALEDVLAAEHLPSTPSGRDGVLRSWCVGIPAAPELFCPIARTLMTDPVRAADHFVYERESILTWWQSGALTSPMTNLVLDSEALTPEEDTRASVAAIVEAYADWRAEVLDRATAAGMLPESPAHRLLSGLRQWPLLVTQFVTA